MKFSGKHRRKLLLSSRLGQKCSSMLGAHKFTKARAMLQQKSVIRALSICTLFVTYVNNFMFGL